MASARITKKKYLMFSFHIWTAFFMCLPKTILSIYRTACCRQHIYSSKSARKTLFGIERSRLRKQEFQIRMVQGVSIVDNNIVNLNPATGEEISRVPCSTKLELDEMVRKAMASQKQWRKIPANERITLLKKGLSVLSQNKEILSRLIVQEMGKATTEAKTEVEFCTSKDEFLDIMAASLQPKAHGSSVVVRHPIGVVTVFSPWNFPADEILLLALPALGAGNTVIVKPSEVVPETGALVVNTLSSVLPDGVLQLAQGDGSVGAYLVEHDGIDFIAMTGSTGTGKNILKAASTRPKLKRFVLELGGKDPMIVFADADLDAAATDAVRYSLSNAGQVCCSIERIFVAEKVYEEFLTKITYEASKYKVGNGVETDVDVGPLASQIQRDVVQEHVRDAVEKGARLLYQSPVPLENEKSSFFPVTVLADVKDGMKIFRQETFGPVVSISPFNGSEELAIELANDTDYGLAGSVYTRDLALARRVAEGIDAGQVGINCYSIENMNVACPWVGHKNSGFGFHSGEEGFNNFSIPKSIVYRESESDEDI